MNLGIKLRVQKIIAYVAQSQGRLYNPRLSQMLDELLDETKKALAIPAPECDREHVDDVQCQCRNEAMGGDSRLPPGEHYDSCFFSPFGSRK